MAPTSEEAGRAVDEIATAVGDVASGAERQVRSVESARQISDDMAGAAATSAEDAAQTAAAAGGERGGLGLDRADERLRAGDRRPAARHERDRAQRLVGGFTLARS